MESYHKVFKAKSGSSSVPQISMRYNAEDEELEQLFDSSPPSETGSINEGASVSLTDSPVLEKKVKDVKLSKRSGSLEDPQGETWKFFSDIKGRITKTVEEKLEEIKSDRLKKKERKKMLVTGGENSSVSDSEERSEASATHRSGGKNEESDGEGSEASEGSVEAGARANLELDPTECHISDTTPTSEFPSSSPPHSKQHSPTKLNRLKGKESESVELGEEVFEESTMNPNDNLGRYRMSFIISWLRSTTILPQCALFLSSQIPLCTYWPAFLPLVCALLLNYFSIPLQMAWLLIGVVITIEGRLVFDWLRDILFPDSELDNPLFTGSFHPDSNPVISPSNINLSLYNKYQGWLNELESDYCVENYKVCQTVTMLVTVEGNMLRVGSPVARVPRRAFYSEPNYPRETSVDRLYNIADCSVSLLPERLTRKRLWSKKYPIYLKLHQKSYIGSSYGSKEFFKNKPACKDESPEEQYFEQEIASEVNIPQNKEEDDLCAKPASTSMEVADNKEDLVTNNVGDDDELDTSDFVHVPPGLVEKKTFLCFFARSDREKEIWYRRLVAATKTDPEEEEPPDPVAENSVDNNKDKTSVKETPLVRERTLIKDNTLMNDYLEFMEKISQFFPKQKKTKWKRDDYSGAIWFNAFLSRIMFDTLNDAYWVSKIQEKLQRKLSTVKLPSLIEELVLSKLHIVDATAPTVDAWSEPRLDEDGLWADLDISYTGRFSMTIDIKLNLVKKKPSSSEIDLTLLSSAASSNSKAAAAYNSSVEDSGESSSDEIDRTKLFDTPTPSSPQKLNVVQRIASSKYFLQMADSKLVKRALEGVSNTNISLIVEVKGLTGTIAVNIPPPPTDRIWYGFRSKPKPKLALSARPIVGERVFKLANITKWIEKRLYKEFEKILVLPNMDDLIIPSMNKDLPT